MASPDWLPAGQHGVGKDWRGVKGPRNEVCLCDGYLPYRANGVERS